MSVFDKVTQSFYETTKAKYYDNKEGGKAVYDPNTVDLDELLNPKKPPKESPKESPKETPKSEPAVNVEPPKEKPKETSKEEPESYADDDRDIGGLIDENKAYSNYGDAFKENVKASPFGTRWRELNATRLVYEDALDEEGNVSYYRLDNELIPVTLKPTEDEKLELLKASDNDVDIYKRSLAGSASIEDAKEKAEIYKENKRIQEKTDASGIGYQLIGGVGNAIGNPGTYLGAVIPGGSALKGGALLTKFEGNKLAINAIKLGADMGAASSAAFIANFANRKLSAIERSYLEDFIGVGISVGALKGGAFIAGKTMKAIRQTLDGLPSDPSEYNWIQKTLTATADTYKWMNKWYNIGSDKLLHASSAKEVIRLFGEKNADVKNWYRKSFKEEQGGIVYNGDGRSLQVKEPTVILEEELARTKREYEPALQEARAAYHEALGLLRGEVDAEQKLNNYWNQFLDGDLQPEKHSRLLAENKRLNDALAKVAEMNDVFGAKGVRYGIFDGTHFRFKDGYSPVQYDRIAVSKFVEKAGSVDRAINMLATNLREGLFRSRKHLKAKYQEYVDNIEFKNKDIKDPEKRIKPGSIDSKEFYDWMAQDAKETAWGIVDMNRNPDHFNPRDGTDIKFAKHRRTWNLNYVNPVDNFSVSQLRSHPLQVTSDYYVTMAGETSYRKVHGHSTAEGIEEVKRVCYEHKRQHNFDPKVEREANRAEEAMIGEIKAICGRNLAKNDLGVSDAVSQIVGNIAYGISNFWFGALNIAETAVAIHAYGFRFICEALPGVRKFVDKLYKDRPDKETIDAFKDFFGAQEVLNRIPWRETLRQSETKFASLHPFWGKAVGYTAAIADVTPGTYMLREITNTILDASMNCFYSELINIALGKRVRVRGFLGKRHLKHIAISEMEFKRLLKDINDCFDLDSVTGKRVLNNQKLARIAYGDGGSAKVMRRLCEYVRDETLQRRKDTDIFMYQLSKANPIMRLVMQFKSFAIQSYNKRFKRMLNRVAEGDALGQAVEFLIGTALSSIIALGAIHTSAMTMSEERRKKYLGYFFNGNGSLSEALENGDGLTSVAKLGLMRHPVFASIMLGANALGIGTKAKTTAVASVGGDSGYSPITWDPVSTGVDMVATSRVIKGGASAGASLVNGVAGFVYDNDDAKKAAKKQAYKAVQSLFPNDPFWKFLSERVRDNVYD